MNNLSEKHENLQNYYGSILGGSHDLKTNACCCDESSMPLNIRGLLNEIDHELVDRFYGCGFPIPSLLENCKVLDLGCGTGRNVYILSRLVGEDGFVTGVDMTDEQLEVGRNHIDSMMKKYGYQKANIDFKKGYIEDLKLLGLENDSFDVVVSNCVINLSPYKQEVFK